MVVLFLKQKIQNEKVTNNMLKFHLYDGPLNIKTNKNMCVV